MPRKLFLSGFIAYLGLLVLATLFYLERTAFIDIAFHLYAMIRDGDFAIQNYRFGAGITQALPLVFIKLGAGLNTLLVLYSIVFILYYLLCYILCGVVFKNHKLALVLLFLNVLFAADTFYWIQSELQQGLAFLITYFAYLSTLKEDSDIGFHLPFVIAGVITIAFFHPLLIFPFGFFTIFFWLEKNMSPRWLIRSAGFFLLAVLIKAVFFRTEYDHQAMGGMKNFLTLFPDYFRLHSNKLFLISCITKFYWIPVFFIAIIVRYFWLRSWLKLFLFLCCFSCYLLLVNVSYAFSGTASFYMENLYLPLSLMLGLPFVYDILPLADNRIGWALTLILIITTTAFVRIYNTHKPYTARLSWEQKFLEENRQTKMIIPETPELREKLTLTWATSYEFWLLSTIKYGQTASIIISDSPQPLIDQKDQAKAFMITWGPVPYTELPSKYFKMKDTVSGYIVK